ncbi:U-actitoxin-Avd11a-like [Actinia tenebrosa]|uniref:U-actitoxin-Avd11a-like n=1 Tax=Actinia tenebrosa TaxID=6105 RepID=A0A6P8HXU6_ACTTE|nr:U-actitoxin-Avd11a-like [Actinia tenebrosa]
MRKAYDKLPIYFFKQSKTTHTSSDVDQTSSFADKGRGNPQILHLRYLNIMNSKLIVVFLLCAILVVSVTSRPERSWDDLDGIEEYEEKRTFKRGCSDYKSSTYCNSVKSRNECGISKYRSYCRKSCVSC